MKFLSIVWHSTKVIHNSSQSGQEKSDSRWHHKLVLYRPVCYNIVRGRSGRETGLPIRNCVPIYRELFKELYESLSVLFWNLWEQLILSKSAWSGPRVYESHRCEGVCLYGILSTDLTQWNICFTHVVNIWGHGFLNLHDHSVCL